MHNAYTLKQQRKPRTKTVLHYDKWRPDYNVGQRSA